MGWGDEIMVTAQARDMQTRDPRPVRVVGREGRPRTHVLWDGNPRFAGRDLADDQVQKLVNGSGARPYVDYAAMGGDAKDRAAAWRYTDWAVDSIGPGEIMLDPSPRTSAVVIEPHVKDNASPNKRWPWFYAEHLVATVALDWIQLGPIGTRILAGARHVPTHSFLGACEELAAASAAVLPEGGLHHAAAALGIPAVVIFGGMTSPANTGYSMHRNLYRGAAGSPCGERLPCAHCDVAMTSIAPGLVAEHLSTIL